jgi:hypothetical protein
VASSTSTILGNKPKREKRADTKQNLILSALGLFAEQGIDAVSMRTINNAAGTKNASAVHYHFGNNTRSSTPALSTDARRYASWPGCKRT